MCRGGKDNEERRCGCDTTEDRRLRRRNGTARRIWSKFVTQLTSARFHPEVKHPDVNGEVIAHRINALHSNLNAIQATEDHNTIINLTVQADIELNQIGAMVSDLAETKYGAPSDEMLKETFKENGKIYAKELRAMKKEARKQGMSRSEAGEFADEITFKGIGAKLFSEVEALVEKRNNAFKLALEESGVTFADPESLQFGNGSDASAVESLKKAVSFYPKSWVDASNDENQSAPLIVRDSGEDRARYVGQVDANDGSGKYHSELVVQREEEGTLYIVDKGFGSSLHEFAHRVEDTVPYITALEETFLMRRTGRLPFDGETIDPEKMKPIFGRKGSADEEVELGYRDNFPDPYMGKVYEDHPSREILSMGMESLFGGSTGGLAGMSGHKPDPDYKKFILGMLAFSARQPS